MLLTLWLTNKDKKYNSEVCFENAGRRKVIWERILFAVEISLDILKNEIQTSCLGSKKKYIEI